MELSASEVWTQILSEARTTLPEQAFKTWLAPTQAISVSRDTLIVSTDNPFAVHWVEDKYASLLAGIAERLYGTPYRVSVQLSPAGSAVDRSYPYEPPIVLPPQPPAALWTAKSPSESTSTGASTFQFHTPLSERYTFDRFVVGHNNQLAAAAAHAVAEAPGRIYNPLFIYGGVGLGKTHLMHAIGHAVGKQGKRVLYLSSERFMNELIGAIQGAAMAEFRRLYRQIDVLLIDDIQFLKGKVQTQEEFFHTFNDLHDAQRQIVITSDRPPKDVDVENRLISRFEWGLVADIQPPDFETRVAILRKRAEEDGIEISGLEEVLDYIGKHCTSSVRELEGAVIKLLAYSSLTRRDITIDLAKEALSGVLRTRPEDRLQLTPELVRQRVAEAWGTSTADLESKKRTKELTVPRQVAMYLIKEMFELSLVEIGRLFGGRDHSTVIHSVSKVEEDLTTDAVFRDKVAAVRQSLARGQ